MADSGVQVRFTGRRDGHLGLGRPDAVDAVAMASSAYDVLVPDVSLDVVARRRAIVDLPWTWLRQHHGAEVVTVTSPGEGAGASADGAVTAEPGCALAVLTADCAPVALASVEGVAGVAHAGWRGLLAGVVERTVEAMRAVGATHVTATLGPCVRAECYEFDADGVDTVAATLGDSVRGRSSRGRPALDLAAGVRSALARAGVGELVDSGVCTACSTDHFSWRGRRDPERQAAVVWRWT